MWPPTCFKNHTAIVFQDIRLTYSQIDTRVNRLSTGLLSLGLTTGHKVAVLLNNGLESAISLLAVPRAGLTYISLNTRHSSKEHAAILNDSEADAIIVGEEFIEKINPVLTLVPSLKHIIVVGQAEGDRLMYEELIANQSETKPDVDVDYENDIERIQYTSGTTGKPKGVVWTFGIGYNVLTSTLMNMDQPIGPETVNLNIGPLTHAAGLMMMVYYSRGATNIILPGFDEEAVLKTIEREKVTSLLLIPTMLYRLLMFPDLLSYDLSSVKRIWYGTAPMAVDRLKEGIRVFGNVFRQNYGMTEIAQPITFLGPEDHIIDGTDIQTKRLASAGKPAMGVEVKIASDNGNEVEPGEVGEILLRSNKLMKGYWKMPRETAEAFKDGWFHTRDMATTDSDGYIYIVDRKSDLIISGGFNIYPREVEEVIMAYPGVAETAVIGVPDAEWGEAVKAIVVTKQGVEVTVAEIVQHCRKHLAGYKKPKSVDFIEEIPKNLYGKIDRRALKMPFWKGYERLVH
jgi:acyl-CoA synthetase (AMP-forming)/AMP-acid ligase II